jgi:hypothetical protein
VSDTTSFTPVQERTFAVLRRGTEPMLFDAVAITTLIDQACAGIAELSGLLGGEKLWVSKGFLNTIHGCEAQHLAPDDFAWKPATASGFVAHKAIELGVHWRGTPSPEQLVDEAIASLADDSSRKGDFVAGLTDGEHAALRGRAIERTTKFIQQFPPLDPRSHPMLEAAVRWRPDGSIELGGKADLVIGRPQGRESRRVIIDFKTGGRATNHREDLRFYALLETLAYRVPPRRLVTYYLDSADCEVEDVTLGVLHAALRRTLDGIAAHAALTVGGREPVKRVGFACRWCPLHDHCTEGMAFLRRDDASAEVEA